MPLHFAGKKILTGALALSLVAGSGLAVPAVAGAAAVALTTPFKDISVGHWAEKHVAKLALQGIITGYASGSSFVFLPNQSVTQQEAVLMALRFAGLESKADKEQIIGFPSSFTVSNYFKPYIVLAFEEGLLDQTEEYALALKDPKTAWGTKPASREWVTKLMIRAIKQDVEAAALQNAASSFTDAAQIDTLYKGYVNAASKLELVKGVTAVKFDPKANVTRASLATLFSRAQKLFPVDYEGQTNGIISKLTGTSITLFSDKKETTYELSPDTLFYHYNSEKPITKEQLLEYGDVTVIAKAGKALYVEVKGDKPYTKTVSGTLDRVITAEKKLYVWVDNKPIEVFYNEKLVVADETGKPIDLSTIKRDSPISIVQDTFRESPLALKIIASPLSTASSAKGMFYATDGELITIKEGTTLVSKFMADAVTVEIEGMSGATTTDLIKEADQVELTLNADDAVTKIKVVNRNVKVIAGAQIASYVYDKKLLTIVDASGGNAQALYFTDKTKIEYSGNTISLASANNLLTQNRKIIISYTGNAIVSLQFVTKYTGTLISMNQTANLMTVRLDSGVTVSVPYTSAYVEKAGVPSAALSDLKAGDLLTLELTSNQERVATIKVHSSAQYEVVSVDSVNKKLNVKNASIPLFELSVLSTELVNERGVKLNVEQIPAGAIISTAYVGKEAAVVRMVNVTYGKVQSISQNSVTITDLTGKSIVYNGGDAGFSIIDGTAQGAATSLLSVGDYVEVLIADTNKTQFTVAVGESRVFTSYNAAASQVWTEKVSDADNRNYFNVTSSTKYMQNGNALTVQSLKAGDTIVIYGFRNNAIEIVKQ
jgi:hypothetical protein